METNTNRNKLVTGPMDFNTNTTSAQADTTIVVLEGETSHASYMQQQLAIPLLPMAAIDYCITAALHKLRTCSHAGAWPAAG